MFLIDLREIKGKGLSINPIPAMLNHNTNGIAFDDARIPASSLVG